MRLVFKDFPLASHDLARGAHVAARCAGAAGSYWPYHHRLFAMQPHFERADLVRYATELGLDQDAFTRCLDSPAPGAAIDADIAQGRAMGVTGTPTFFINGRVLVGAHPPESFRRIVDEALRSR